ncbi:hypothetical protein BDF22DRAFT_688359 [Syncephalis plumigaleata]|nr:hypothetical protein BDF22DRAFT_688359 [Syncephalis plumigaleata]
MNTAKVAKHNLNQALTWLICIHLIAVYYLDSSLVFLIFRGYMQWNLSIPSLPVTLRGSILLITAMTLICGLRRLQPLDGTGIIIDFIGIAPGSGRLSLLFHDIVIAILQLLMLISIYQSTNELDDYSHGSSLLTSYSNRSTTPVNRWWIFSRRDQETATASRDSANIRGTDANGTSSTNSNNNGSNTDALRNARLASLANYRASTSNATTFSPQSTTTDEERIMVGEEEHSPSDHNNNNNNGSSNRNNSRNSNDSANSDDYSTSNTRQRGIDRIWPASRFHSNQARYERLEDTLPDSQDDSYEEQLNRYYNASVEAYDLGGVFVINCSRTLRQNWTQYMNDNDSASSERRPLPV